MGWEPSTGAGGDLEAGSVTSAQRPIPSPDRLRPATKSGHAFSLQFGVRRRSQDAGIEQGRGRALTPHPMPERATSIRPMLASPPCSDLAKIESRPCGRDAIEDGHNEATAFRHWMRHGGSSKGSPEKAIVQSGCAGSGLVSGLLSGAPGCTDASDCKTPRPFPPPRRCGRSASAQCGRRCASRR